MTVTAGPEPPQPGESGEGTTLLLRFAVTDTGVGIPASEQTTIFDSFTQVEGGLTCILVDDGSPDESGALCDAWAAKDDRVTVIHQDDLGVSGARNSGLAAADSEFIVF